MKIALRVFTVYLLCMALVACSGNDADKSDEEEAENASETEDGQEETATYEIDNTNKYDGKQGDYEVVITGEMVEEDDKIYVEGETNLLPGSTLIGEVAISTDTD